MAKKDEDDMGDIQAESDLRTLIEAAKIGSDKARYRAALKAKAKMMAGLKAIKSTSAEGYLDE